MQRDYSAEQYTQATCQTHDSCCTDVICGAAHALLWEPAAESAAVSRFAIDREDGAVMLQNVLDDGESQPSAATVAMPGLVNPVKPLRKPWDMGCRDANTRIRHHKTRAFALSRPGYGHATFYRGVFHGIEHQIGERAVDFMLGSQQKLVGIHLEKDTRRALAEG